MEAASSEFIDVPRADKVNLAFYIPIWALEKQKFREEHSEVDTGPLNDILFILLMFFSWYPRWPIQTWLKMSVPKAKSDTKQKQSVVVSCW